MSIEAMKLALWHEAMAREPNRNQAKREKHEATSKFIREALAKQEQDEPVAWLINDKKINHLQIKSIKRLIERARHAHMTNIELRINGQYEWYEGDWIKHMVEAPQPRKPLTDEQIMNALKLKSCDGYREIVRAIEAAHGIKEST